MTTINSETLTLNGLGQSKRKALERRAKDLGMTPRKYLRHLVEEDLAISEKARTTSFAELFGPGTGDVDEAELDRLVDEAKAEHHAKVTRKKR